MSKEITFKIDEIKKGIDISCDAIKQTVGPRGKNGFIDDKFQPLITNDGKSIADSITLNGYENMGNWLVKNTCDKTFEDVGDATTTTAILLQAIINESLKRPENPVKIKKALKDIGKKIESWIDQETIKVIKESQIKDIATVASESKEIGEFISNIVKKVGKDTPIYIEEDYYGSELKYEIVPGLETKNGYISSNNPFIELENAAIFVTDKKINNLMEIKELLTILENANITSPVFIVPDIEETAYKFFMKLNEKGAFNYVVIRAKGTELFDMASACNATVISSKNGLDFKDVKNEHLGIAKKIIVTQYKSVIVSDETPNKKKAIDDLIKQAEETTNIYDKQNLMKRAEALKGGIAIIKVGAPTNSERGYLRLKILNAVNTTKIALSGGIVEGGGMCLYRISNKIKGNSIGEEILRKALKEPLKNIIENAGDDYAVIARKIQGNKGYNAETGKAVDMIKDGVIDSAKSTKVAFINALSSASEFITVGVAITNEQNQSNTQNK